MFKSLMVVAVATLTCASVIPSECFNENLTSHTITKREEKIDGWMFNSQPIEIGPTVEASMAPNLQSRMCAYQDGQEEEEDNLKDFFVTMDDFSNLQMESRNAAQEEIPTQNFIDTPEAKSVWNQEKPTNEVPKEYAQQQPVIIEEYPDMVELVAEVDPSEEELVEFFYHIQNLPDNLPNKEVPIIINYEEVQPPKENPFDDSSVREDSEVVAEANDMIHGEISESEKGDKSQGSHEEAKDASISEESQGNPEDDKDAGKLEQSGSETESKQEPQTEDVEKSEEEKLNELRQSLEQLKHMDVQDVQEKIDGYLKELKSETANENNTTETNNGTESILS